MYAHVHTQTWCARMRIRATHATRKSTQTHPRTETCTHTNTYANKRIGALTFDVGDELTKTGLKDRGMAAIPCRDVTGVVVKHDDLRQCFPERRRLPAGQARWAT